MTHTTELHDAIFRRIVNPSMNHEEMVEACKALEQMTERLVKLEIMRSNLTDELGGNL